jgi:hypothetical protein
MPNTSAIVREVGNLPANPLGKTDSMYMIAVDGHSNGANLFSLFAVDGVTRPGKVTVGSHPSAATTGYKTMAQILLSPRMPVGVRSGRVRLTFQVKWTWDGTSVGVGALGRLAIGLYSDTLGITQVGLVESEWSRILSADTTWTDVLVLEFNDITDLLPEVPGGLLTLRVFVNVAVASSGSGTASVHFDPETAGNEFVVQLTQLDRGE